MPTGSSSHQWVSPQLNVRNRTDFASISPVWSDELGVNRDDGKAKGYANSLPATVDGRGTPCATEYGANPNGNRGVELVFALGPVFIAGTTSQREKRRLSFSLPGFRVRKERSCSTIVKMLPADWQQD